MVIKSYWQVRCLHRCWLWWLWQWWWWWMMTTTMMMKIPMLIIMTSHRKVWGLHRYSLLSAKPGTPPLPSEEILSTTDSTQCSLINILINSKSTILFQNNHNSPFLWENFHLHQIKRKLCFLHKETAKLCQLLRIFHLKIFRQQFVNFNIFFYLFCSHFCQKVQASPLFHSGTLQASCLVERRQDCRVILGGMCVSHSIGGVFSW